MLRDGSHGEGVVAKIMNGRQACLCWCALWWNLQVDMLTWSGCKSMDLGLRDWNGKLDEFGVGDCCDGCKSCHCVQFSADNVEDE